MKSIWSIMAAAALTRGAAFAPPAAAQTRFPLMAWDYAEDEATFEAMRDCGITSVAFVPIRLDRLGRSLHLLVALIEELGNRGAGFRSVSEGFKNGRGRDLPPLALAAGSAAVRRLISMKQRCGPLASCTTI